jgi:hypothetical protein
MFVPTWIGTAFDVPGRLGVIFAGAHVVPAFHRT